MRIIIVFKSLLPKKLLQWLLQMYDIYIKEYKKKQKLNENKNKKVNWKLKHEFLTLIAEVNILKLFRKKTRQEDELSHYNCDKNKLDNHTMLPHYHTQKNFYWLISQNFYLRSSSFDMQIGHRWMWIIVHTLQCKYMQFNTKKFVSTFLEFMCGFFLTAVHFFERWSSPRIQQYVW